MSQPDSALDDGPRWWLRCWEAEDDLRAVEWRLMQTGVLEVEDEDLLVAAEVLVAEADQAMANWHEAAARPLRLLVHRLRADVRFCRFISTQL